MKDKLQELYNKSGTRKVLASLISILIGLVVGAVVVIAVGLSKDTITNQGRREADFRGHPVHRTERGGQPDLGLQCPGSGQYAIPGNTADHDRPFRGRGL